MPQRMRYSCTACGSAIKTSFEARLHPLLQCLMCQDCHKMYGDGDFSVFEDGVDANGDDNFCRWCIDGGDLFACSNEGCHYMFCTECMKRNFPDEPILKIKEARIWHCYACDSDRMEPFRKAASEAIRALDRRDLKRQTVSASTGAHSNATPKRRKTNELEKSPTKGSSTHKEKSSSHSSTIKESKSFSRESHGPEEKPINNDSANKQKQLPDSKEAPNSEESSVIKEQPSSTKEPSAARETEKNTTKENHANKELPSSTIKETSLSRDKSSSREKIVKDPEASSMPPLEKPRPPITSLRQLHGSNKPRPSKQLKCPNEQINPSTRIPLSEAELKKKLQLCERMKNHFIKEIETKFNTILEMFDSKELAKKALIKAELEDLERPNQEFNNMLNDLRSIWYSQT